MKNLIVCCDGTWNTPDQEQWELPAPSNVVRLFNCIHDLDANGAPQLKYYHSGVGTEGGLLQKVAGGLYGDGLGKNVMSAYAWLAQHYEVGDHIFLFGFSRGAFTARSLGGMLSRCGLIDIAGLESKVGWQRVETVFNEGYQKHGQPWRVADWKFRAEPQLPIHFIGVWDTVGALGIPDDLALLNILDDPDKWRFWDTTLGANVANARHAVAIDEMRASFTPTLWTNEDGTARMDAGVKQLWFAGVHADVGGGYQECGLSDIALRWMVDEAAGCGLRFNSDVTGQIGAIRAQAPMHNSLRGVFGKLRTRPRNVPATDEAQWYHPSVLDRIRIPPITQCPYHGTRRLKKGDVLELPVYAREHWNRTGVYLEVGAEYKFTATGEWMDKDDAFTPDGKSDGGLGVGEIARGVGDFLGTMEGWFKHAVGNRAADFWGSRRVETANWMALIGVVANDGVRGAVAVANDGSPHAHQSFVIGSHANLRPIKGGFLFAFANDAWSFYDNNRGTVILKIERIS